MSQPPPRYLTKLARNGDQKSLNTLLCYFIRNIGTTARLSIKHSCIELILEGYTATPDQQQSEKYLRRFFCYLQIPQIKEVKIFAKNYDTQRLAWWSTLQVNCLRSELNSLSQNNSESSYKSTKRHTANQAFHLTNTLIADKLQIPQPVAFENLPNNLQVNIRRAGLRPGETRSYQEAKQIYEMMPENIRRGGADAIQSYKQKHDWSHKKAHTKGGSSRPNNGDWEHQSLNRSRGSRRMTKAETENLTKAKAQINFKEGSKIVASQAVTAGAMAFGVEVAFSGLENFLAVKRGEKTVEQALSDTLTNSASATVCAVAVVGGISALTLTFPPAGLALAAATPFLQLVGAASTINRLVTVLSKSGKVQGIDQVEELMLSYGIDDVELNFRDLEVEDELLNLKLAMQRVD